MHAHGADRYCDQLAPVKMGEWRIIALTPIKQYTFTNQGRWPGMN
jgi:hypothetical protein